MILSLHLVNFESHEDSLIKFNEKGITVIKGSTDQGKSTVRRALTYVVFSTPVQGRPGNKLKESYVTIRCSGIPAITRGRTGGKKGKNYYRIGPKVITDGKESDPLKAFKRKVPEEISRMLNLSEVNIQEQFKEYYLLQSTAGQVAKTLHKLLGMDLVDKTARVANSAITAQKQLLESRRLQVKSIKEDIKKYDYVETLESELSELELSIQDYEELEAKNYNLTTLLERCRILQQRIAAAKIPDLVEINAKALMADILEYNKTQEKVDRLYQQVKAVNKINKRQRELKDWLQVETKATEVQNMITDFQALEIKSQRLVSIITQLQEQETKIINVNQTIRYTNKKLIALKKKVKVCPVCGQAWRK